MLDLSQLKSTRYKVAAAIFSLLTYGVGQIYGRQYKAGIALLVFYIVLPVLWAIPFNFIATSLQHAVFYVTAFAFLLTVLII